MLPTLTLSPSLPFPPPVIHPEALLLCFTMLAIVFSLGLTCPHFWAFHPLPHGLWGLSILAGGTQTIPSPMSSAAVVELTALRRSFPASGASRMPADECSGHSWRGPLRAAGALSLTLFITLNAILVSWTQRDRRALPRVLLPDWWPEMTCYEWAGKV